MKLLAALRRLILACLVLATPATAAAEDGYDLWLRYQPLPEAQARAYGAAVTELVAGAQSPTLAVAEAELQRGLGAMLGSALSVSQAPEREGALIFGTPASSPAVAALNLPLGELGPEGYLIRSVTVGGRRATVIAANSDVGVLYGAFRFLQVVQGRQSLERLDIVSAPKVQIRVLNHWDNLDRTVERGYAGFSLWDWHKLPDFKDPRYVDYARANASIGINGTVLTNVNANATVLTPQYLEKAAALADVFRPYGLKVYLTARFSAPIEIGGLKTADPLDPQVRAWWKAKTDEIYRYIPDFGGFLVKANSEGQPGPQDYKRTHVDGANMLAQAVGDRGVVMWRAFVYSHEQPDDRHKQGYDEFKPFDGQFAPNVIVQVKNGAIDFQPREPFHPLFGAMSKTPVMMEFQITKEYLGFATHLAYLGTMWEETLQSDTYAKGKGSTVAKVIDGELFGYRRTGMAGVANIGTDRNWSGSQFDQANWFAFGRMAWDPDARAEPIAREWAALTFTPERGFVDPAVKMMMGSREAVVNYTGPLGLHHLMGRSHHYGPGPWVEGGPRADWTSVYYHRADANGVGFDRTAKGSNAVSQYAPPVAAKFNDPRKIDERDLLWFHHLPWDWKVKSGRTLWDELVVRYTQGVSEVADMRATWTSLAPYVDAERYAEVSAFLGIQEKEAQWWRDASIAYFQSISKRPLPSGYAAPPHDLDHYKSLEFPYAPGI
jgi:alpha-glucuronidase